MTRRLLFVDGDPAMLAGVRQSLWRHRREWQIDTATSGPKALERLAGGGYDLLCADLQLGGTSGVELLRRALELHPEVARIVLTSANDGSWALEAVTLAHQFLSKPCEPQRLERTLIRCLGARDLVRCPALRLVLGDVTNLPPVPRIYARLTEVMAREDAGVRDVAAVVQDDPSVAARVVQVANSAFFRLPRAVATVEAAVNHLGFNTVRSLVTSAEVFRQFAWPAGLPFSHERLASHSLQVASVARILAGPGGQAGEAFLAGLVHDIGYLVLAERAPAALQELAARATAEQRPMWQLEQEVIGAGHAEVGAYLLGVWGLPDPVVEATALHHARDVEFEAGSIAAAVRAAEELVDCGTCAWSGDEAVLAQARKAAGALSQQDSVAGTPKVTI